MSLRRHVCCQFVSDGFGPPRVCFFLARMWLQMCEHTLKIVVRKLGVAVEAKEIGLPRHRRGHALLPEKFKQSLHHDRGRAVPKSSVYLFLIVSDSRMVPPGEAPVTP